MRSMVEGYCAQPLHHSLRERSPSPFRGGTCCFDNQRSDHRLFIGSISEAAAVQVGETFAQCRAWRNRQFERAVAARQPQPGAVCEGDVIEPLLPQSLERLRLQFAQRDPESLAQRAQPTAFADSLDRGVLLAVLGMAALGIYNYQRLPIDAVPDITNEIGRAHV